MTRRLAILLLFGARFGGGCTSGHMISGISQLAVSSMLFTAALFAGAMLTVRYLYPYPNRPNREGRA
jgi:uncharacterized membrane protein YedE/YeeE